MGREAPGVHLLRLSEGWCPDPDHDRLVAWQPDWRPWPELAGPSWCRRCDGWWETTQLLHPSPVGLFRVARRCDGQAHYCVRLVDLRRVDVRVIRLTVERAHRELSKFTREETT